MMVVTEAILSTFFGALGKKITDKLDEVKPKDIQVVTIRRDPDQFSSTALEKKTTTNQKWQTKSYPDMQFDNALKKDSIVREISLMPDTVFRTKGKIRITIDDVEVFISKSFDAFDNIQDTVVRVNKTISQDSKVKIFLLSSDGSAVGMTAQVTFGE